MKTLTRILTIALTVMLTQVYAQGFQGIATYKTQRKIDIKMDSTQINSDMHKQMMAMMKKQFQKTFQLTFNKEASVYKQDAELAKPQVGGDNMRMVIMGSDGGENLLYKNTKTNVYAGQKDAMGKIFLVKDDIEKIEWKLESDTKYIGEYPCFKATYVKQVEVMKHIDFSHNSKTKKPKEDQEKAQKTEMEERIVTAWYTPQIPVNNGPALYQGLPGLILEVHDGDLTMICSKIVLNPEEQIEIKAPTKGKEVNQKKYDEIMEKKTKEMMERYRPSRSGHNNGENIEIRIRG